MPPSQQQIIGRLNPPLARDMLRRGFKVQAKARVFLSGTAGHPKRVDTGQLRSSVQVQLRQVGGSAGGVVVRIGSNLKRSIWVHDGTGIYGPRKVLIKPKRAKVLRFKPKGAPRTIYVRSVKGMKPNRFLKDALSAARD